MTDRLAKAFPFLLIAPAILPIVYVSGLVFPYISIKIFSLWTIGILAFATFIFLALSGKPFFYRRLRSPVSWIPLVLLAVQYVTSYFGMDFYHSFWGLFERGDGLLTSTIITIFFYLILISADRQLLERLVKTIVVIAGVVAGIAVLQWITTIFGGSSSFLPPINGRIGSTFGNAAFLAGYLGMAFFVSLIVMRDSVGHWLTISRTAIVLSVLAILFAATRGTILALIVVVFITAFYLAFMGVETTKQIARYGLIGLVIFAGIFIGFREQFAKVPFEPIQRMASISLTDGTVSSRLFVWRNIGAEALQRPFIGYGAEHVARLFDKVYDPSKILEQWFDRSHNAYLDYFAQYGAFGLVLYLALTVSFVLYAWRLYRREEPSVLNYGFLFLLFITIYAIQNFFVFDTPHSLWLLYAMFAALLILLDDSSSFAVKTKFAKPITVAVSVLILLLIFPVVIQPLRANILLTQGYLLHLVDVNKANAYFEKGLSLGTYADLEYGYQAYSMYTDHQVVQLEGENLNAGYQYALSLLTKNFNKYPYDARTATYLAHVLDTAPEGVKVDDDFNKNVLARAMELSPLRVQSWYMTVNVSLRNADALPEGSPEKEKYYREAIKTLEKYAGLEPSLPVAPYILATIYYKLGDKAAAKKWADDALSAYINADPAAARPAVKYYLAINDWRNAVRFLADLVEENPSDYDVLYDLAKVTYLAGDPAASLRIVEKLRKEDPAILVTDQNFLNAITSYEQSKK